MPRSRRSPNAADALVRVSLLGSRWVERLLAGHDPPLTPALYLTLQAAGESGLVGSELARRLDVSPAAVSQLLASLEDAGLVQRARGTDDRRRQPLALTSEGARVLQSAGALLRAHLGPLLPHQADALQELAARLAGEPLPPRPPGPPGRLRR